MEPETQAPHSRGGLPNLLSGFRLLAAPMMLFPAWPFRCAAVFQALEACEEIAITCLLPQRHSNVPRLWHARRLAAGMD